MVGSTSPPLILSNIRLSKESREPPTASPPLPSPESEAVTRELDTPRLTLGKIGKAIGVSRFAMEKYRNGQRALPETLRERLIAYLEAHAREIQADADALRSNSR